MQNIFESNARTPIGTNRFDLSHDRKFTCRMGEIVPTAAIECYPGDIFNISVENMFRFLPLLAPVMHRINIKTRYFFVPNRLMWPGWEDFITNKTPDVEAPYFKPTPSSTDTPLVGSIGDYLGYPTAVGNDDLEMSAFPTAAYCLIYDEWFRDQNLQNTYFTPLAAGNNAIAMATVMNGTSPFKCAWERDYFTASLPFAQAGDPVTLPLTTSASVPVTTKPLATSTFASALIRTAPDGALTTAAQEALKVNTSGQMFSDTPASGNYFRFLDPNGNLIVDINEEAVLISDLRTAFATQSFLERLMRGGQRYRETIFSMFGVKTLDARMQVPEFIGMATQNMVISEVLSSAQTQDNTDQVTPLGQMGGHGISVGKSNSFSYRCTEHGWIIGVVTVTPRTAYQQGLHRSFSRKSPLDYYFPDFAHLGEQAVLLKEVYAQSASAVAGDATFGYQPPFEELRFLNSSVHGLMKTDLDYWHLGRIFASAPALNSAFITCDPSSRIFAVDDESDYLVAHIFNNISAVRKLPRYGIPSTLT